MAHIVLFRTLPIAISLGLNQTWRDKTFIVSTDEKRRWSATKKIWEEIPTDLNGLSHMYNTKRGVNTFSDEDQKKLLDAADANEETLVAYSNAALTPNPFEVYPDDKFFMNGDGAVAIRRDGEMLDFFGFSVEYPKAYTNEFSLEELKVIARVLGFSIVQKPRKSFGSSIVSFLFNTYADRTTAFNALKMSSRSLVSNFHSCTIRFDDVSSATAVDLYNELTVICSKNKLKNYTSTVTLIDNHKG